MTRFDFKKWVVEHKHGKQSLNEQSMGDKSPRSREGGKEMMPAPCDSGPFGPLGCETFQECGTTTLIAYHFMGGPASYTNTLFHSFVGSPSVGDVVEIEKNDGTILKLEYMGVIPATSAFNLGNSSDWTFVGPSTCVVTVPVNGCTDSTATNYNSSANTDDGSCFYGYNCRKQTSPQDVGVNEWVGIDMCFEAPLGTTGTFPDLASCSNVCGPRGRDTGKTRDQPYVPIATNPDVPTIDY